MRRKLLTSTESNWSRRFWQSIRALRCGAFNKNLSFVTNEFQFSPFINLLATASQTYSKSQKRTCNTIFMVLIHLGTFLRKKNLIFDFRNFWNFPFWSIENLQKFQLYSPRKNIKKSCILIPYFSNI